MITTLLLVAAIQSPPPIAIPPPPAIPIVVWVGGDGSLETAHLVLINPVEHLARPVEEVLSGRLHIANHVVVIDLHRVGSVAQVPAGGYLSVDYSFHVPQGLGEYAVLNFSGDEDGYRFKLGSR